MASPLKITGNKTLQGIVYIESPNVVDIQGTVDLQGFIVRRAALTANEVRMLRLAVVDLGLPRPGPTLDSQRLHFLKSDLEELKRVATRALEILEKNRCSP